MTNENTNQTNTVTTPVVAPVATADEVKAGKGKRVKKPAAPRAARTRTTHDFIIQVQHPIKVDDTDMIAWVDIPDTKVKDTTEGLRVMAKLPPGQKYRVIYIGAERTVTEETKTVIRLV